jgi:hypothetical protein
MLTSEPVFCTASATVLNTGLSKWVDPPLFGVTPPSYLLAAKDTIAFHTFNEYAGQKNPATATGAFCFFRDALDAADTKRFPESVYGPLIAPENTAAYNNALASVKNPDENSESDDVIEMKQSDVLAQFASKARISKIIQAYAPYGAKELGMGTSDESPDAGNDMTQSPNDNNIQNSNKEPRNPNRQGKNPNRRNKSSGGGGDNMEKASKQRETSRLNDDIGVNLIPGNYSRFLTQYDPNNTSRGCWRVGPLDQPYGRFARRFDSKAGMTEMFFDLNKRFFQGSSQAQKSAIRIIYLDQGTGSWSLNYFNGSNKAEAYRVNCNNTGRWITKTIVLPNAYFTEKLEHGTDVSIKYLSGDNTIFNSIEILRQ